MAFMELSFFHDGLVHSPALFCLPWQVVLHFSPFFLYLMKISKYISPLLYFTEIIHYIQRGDTTVEHLSHLAIVQHYNVV